MCTYNYDFCSSGRGSCLEDMPSSTLYDYPKVLPGVMYSADHQCRLQYGPNATASPMFEVRIFAIILELSQRKGNKNQLPLCDG